MKLKPNLSVIAVFISTLSITGCFTSIKVEPPLLTEHITNVCIKENPAVLMDGFLPELRNQIESHSISTSVYKEIIPRECVYHLTYTANWTWAWAMVLAYAEVKIYRGDALVSRGVYDYGGKFFHLTMYGSTASKLKTITDPMFSNGKIATNYQAVENKTIVSKSSFVPTENNISENKTAVPMTFTTKAIEKPKTTSSIVINPKLIEKIQTALTSDHYYHGAISGELNEDTRNAIAVYKEINNLSGKSIDKAFLNALGIE